MLEGCQDLGTGHCRVGLRGDRQAERIPLPYLFYGRNRCAACIRQLSAQDCIDLQWLAFQDLDLHALYNRHSGHRDGWLLRGHGGW